MDNAVKFGLKKAYLAPIVDVCELDFTKDVLCMSSEGKDNDFGAGDLGDFLE